MDREDIVPCRACGAPCDGGVCDAVCAEEAEWENAVAFLVEEEFDIEGDEVFGTYATIRQDYYCKACGLAEEPARAQALSQDAVNRLSRPYGIPIDCCYCGKEIK